MIWSALHGNMQLPERAGTGVANRLEHMVKRACFKWGIGRELYTAPFIWVPAEKCSLKQGKNGKWACYDRFSVAKVAIEDGRIKGLRIVNEKTGRVAYSWKED